MKRINRFLLSALLFMLSCSAIADAPGKNGSRTIGALNTVINQYDVLAAAAAAGDTSITVSNIANLSSSETTGGGALAAGDVVMLYQPRGASIVTTNSTTYGDISYGNAGNYELRTVRSVAGNVIGLDGASNGAACVAGLKNSYSAGAQVIRVPQYSSLTVSAGASVIASAWGGTTGGVVTALVQGALTVNGSISVNGQGFRGGILDGTDRDVAGVGTATWVSNDNPAGGAKGEGIASGAGGTFGGVTLPYSNPGGNFDIGAPANGGGGGGSHNGGGGGGANAALTLTPYCTTNPATYTTASTAAFVWCGQGVMPAGNDNAWQLDPGYKANSNAKTSHVGGGRGGYTYSANNLDAMTAAGAPGLTAWGGDYRRALGGWGGRPLQQTLSTRLFFGGGGGAGANNPAGNTGGAGGAGGGVILIQAGSLSGTGSITANGSNGVSTTGGGNDGPGGAGAGGTIVLRASSGSISTITANGGAGGNQSITTAEAEGPGGGGGGGLIALTGASTTTLLATGGAGGTTNSPSLTEFPRNGATDGNTGRTGDTAPDLRTGAASCTSLSVAKGNGVNSLVAGGTTTYTLTVVNSGPSLAGGTTVRDPAVTGLSCTSVTCSSVAGGAVCPAAGSTTIALLQGATGITVPTLPANSTATFTLNCSVTATGQ